MKPSIKNLRKVAAESTNSHDVMLLRDSLSFYVAGLKAAALALGKSVNDIEPLIDEARAAGQYIEDRINYLVVGK